MEVRMMNYDYLKEQNVRKIEEYYKSPFAAEKVNFYPRYIQIEHSNLCNAQCIMCNHFFLANKGGKLLQYDAIKKIESILPYCETIMINGDGEPLLNTQLEEYIRLYSSYGVKIGANTNLCHITDSMWELIKDHFAFLNISCDGATKETFELIRRGLKYDTFLDNLKKLNSIAPGLKKNLDCVVMKQNIQEIPLIAKLAVDYGFSCVKFNKIGVNPCINNFNDSEEYYLKTYQEKIDEAVELTSSAGINIRFSHYDKNIDDICSFGGISAYKREIEERLRKAQKQFSDLTLNDDYCAVMAETSDFSNDAISCNTLCKWGIERCYIDLKGNVTTCCYNTRKYMGNLNEFSFEEIWNGKNYLEFRNIMKNKKLPSWCKACNWIENGQF